MVKEHKGKRGNLQTFLKRYYFILSLLAILFASAFARIYNFNQRIGIGSDGMRDAIIGKIALARHELPLIGSFSSAGPFVFGPIFYYFTAVSYLIFPSSFFAPWMLTVAIGILTVALYIYLGYRLAGKRFAIILGLLTALSPQLVARSTFLSQHSLVLLASSLLVLFFVLFWQEKKTRYAFFAGLSLGVGLSLHYQALNLLLFFPALFFVPGLSFQKKIQALFAMLVGFFIPSLPLLYWDSQQNFANLRNILDYLLIAQYRLYVPNSWKLYLLKYFPEYWSNLVGGNNTVSLLMMALTSITFVVLFFKKNIPRLLTVLLVIFLILFVLNRYYRGERFDGYMIYFSPFILLASGWVILTFWNLQTLFNKKNPVIKIWGRNLAILLLGIVLIFNYLNSKQFIFNRDTQIKDTEQVRDFLILKYHRKRFSIYDYKWKTSSYSYAIGAFLQEKGKIDPTHRIPIGIRWQQKPYYSGKGKIILEMPGYSIIDLSQDKEITKAGWLRVNPDDIYDDLITRWTKKQKLTSTFDLIRYIAEKLQGK